MSEHEPRLCCGIVQGFQDDALILSFLTHRPEKRGEWFFSNQQPTAGLRIKVRVNTAGPAWGVLTGRITKVEEGIVEASAFRTTDDDSLPGGPYAITLTYNVNSEFPWELTKAELDGPPHLVYE